MEFLYILGMLFLRHSFTTSQLKLLPKCHFITYTTICPFGLSRPLHFQFILMNVIVCEKTYITKPKDHSVQCFEYVNKFFILFLFDFEV